MQIKFIMDSMVIGVSTWAASVRKACPPDQENPAQETIHSQLDFLEGRLQRLEQLGKDFVSELGVVEALVYRIGGDAGYGYKD